MREGRSPLVSVVIPTLNRPDYLRISLESTLAQTYRNLEVIVQDNASAVDPGDVVNSFGDARVTYYRNSATLNQTTNVVSACLKARGAYLAILGDDDVWDRDFIRSLVQPLETDSSLILAFCDHGIIDAAGNRDDEAANKVARRWRRHLLHEGRYQPFDEIALVNRSICMFSGAVLRRADIDWGTIPLDSGFGLDLYIAYVVARTGEACYYLPQRLAYYRYHPAALGSSLNQASQRLANARDAMHYWDRLSRDRALQRHRRYFEMKRGFNALVIVVSALRDGAWRRGAEELRRYWNEGLIRPTIFLDRLTYALRLQRLNA